VGATDPDSSTSIGGIVLQDQDMYLNTTSGDVFTWIEIDTRRGWQRTKAKRK
jgi:hypothetical protein